MVFEKRKKPHLALETVEASVLLEVKYIGVDIVGHVIEESRSDWKLKMAGALE